MQPVSVRSRVGFGLAALVGIALFAWLGCWQYQRGVQKRERLAQQTAALAAPVPTPLTDALRIADRSAVRNVVGRGRFQRSLLLLDGQQRDGRVGLRIFGIAQPDGVKNALMVDMGWLPLAPNRTMPALQSPIGERDLSGLLGPWPGQGLRAAPNPWPRDNRDSVLLSYLDAGEIERELGLTLHPGVLRLAPELDYGYARDLDPPTNMLPPERHFGYAVQWFGLAAAVLAVYLVLTWRSIRRKDLQ